MLVLTVYRKRRDGFCWRPGWGHNAVVRPSVSIGAMRDAWIYSLSVGRVERALRAVPGVSEASVNLATERATVNATGAAASSSGFEVEATLSVSVREPRARSAVIGRTVLGARRER